MKKCFIFISIIFFSVTSFGQKVSITGAIFDENGKAIPFANVFLTQDTIIKRGSFSDENGKFKIKSSPGNYTFKISFIGYQDWQKDIEIKEDTIFPDIKLTLSTKMMDAVLITEFRNDMKAGIDKKIVHISEDMRRSNTNVAEILELIPIVNMDFDGAPSIPGKRSVIILVDGRTPKIRANDMATVLKSIPSDQILSIEIMTNPPAKYTTSNAAVINLVTKKAPQKGTLLNAWTGYDNLKTLDFGGSFTYQYNKFSLSSWVGQWQWRSVNSSELESIDYLSNSIYKQIAAGESDYYGGGTWFGLSPEFKINDNNIVSIYGGTHTWNNDGSSNGNHTIKNKSDEIIDQYEITSSSNSEGRGFYTGIEYYKLFKEKEKEFSIDIGYNGGSNQSDRYQSLVRNADGYAQHNSSERKDNQISFEAEYFDPIDSTSSINLNFEIEKVFPYDDISNQYEGETLDFLSKNEDYSYKSTYENIEQTLTFTYAKKIKKSSYSLDIGQTYFKYDNLYDLSLPLKTDYLFVTPKVSYTYNFGKSNQIGISYKYGSKVPNSWYLNPNERIGVDKLSISYGNENLNPEKSHQVEMNLGFYWGKFNIGTVAFWRKTNNAISNFREFDDEGIMHSTYLNNGYDLKTGLQLSVSGSLLKKIKINIGGSVYDNRFNDNINETRKSIGYSLNGSINAYLPYNFSFRSYTRFNGPSLLFQGEKSGSFRMGVSIKKSFLKKKLSISLRFRDIFRTSYSETTLETPEFYSFSSYKNHPAWISIRASVRLGKLKEMPKSSKAMQNSRGQE